MTVLSLIWIPAVFASEDPQGTNPGLARSLEANRSLLDQYQDESIRLKKEAREQPSGSAERKLRGVQDKIKALERDSEELRSFLPVNNQAYEFITDLMAKKTQAEKIKLTEAAEELLEEASLKQAQRERTSSPEAVYRMHERALKLVSEKKFREALEIYGEIVLQNPEDDEAYIIMGHSYLLTGQYRKAEDAFHNAVSIDPQNIDEITPFYENMVLQDPEDDAAFADLGYACLILGDTVKAKNAFLQSLDINPQNGPARDGLMHLQRLSENR